MYNVDMLDLTIGGGIPKNLIYDKKIGWIELRGTITIPHAIYENDFGELIWLVVPFKVTD